MSELLYQSPDVVLWQAALVAILVSYLISQCVAFVYMWTHQGVSYSRSFVVSLVAAGLVSTVLMLAIGNNLARGIGIVGTLALIRFRMQLHDPLDMIYVFAAFAEATKLEAGMAPEPTGAGEMLRSADIAPEETVALGAENPYAAAADDWQKKVQAVGLSENLPADLTDSPLGFNHAYPWDFLVRLARDAGVLWWRDWSAKWQTVEPEKGKFDFTAADTQIRRVLNLNSKVEVLLPFPSASWSTTARADEVDKAAGQNEYLRARLPCSYMPSDLNDFGAYAAAVARHYEQSRPRAVTHFQILNEPVYTDYALPRKFGYTLADYLRLAEVGSRALHNADPQCRVVGGISANLEAGLTRDFVAQGGLQWVDVFDLHMYDPARPAESFEDSFRSLEDLMRAHGGPKPVWITEWGCYADDDPPCLPQSVGDATMNRCRWPSERDATEHIVKFTAVSFAHGVRKIFFHAGTCGTINGPDAGGVLFEYGGAPRKMYAGVAALTRLLGVPDECVKALHGDGVSAYVFKSKHRLVAIAWCEAGQARKLKPASGVQVYDIMGNPLPPKGAVLEETPLYLAGESAESILASVAK